MGARSTILALMTIAALALAGCIQPQPDDGDDKAPESDPTMSGPDDITCVPGPREPTGGSSGQSAVSNQPGSFSYSGQVAAKTGKEVYLWENAAEAAQIMWGGQSGAGTMVITLQDGCDKEVYRKEMGGASQQTSAMEGSQEGVPGEWVVTFEFTLYTGQMGLQISSA